MIHGVRQPGRWWQRLHEAMDQFAPAVGPSTAILPILNGMSHLDSLAERFGTGRVLGGLAQISATLDSEGRIIHFGGGELAYGEIAGGSSDRSHALSALFEGGGLAARASDGILQEMWEKWVQTATGAGMTCMMRSAIGDIVAAPGGREAILQLFVGQQGDFAVETLRRAGVLTRYARAPQNAQVQAG
jgi:2-dehydropantoate 2-reductase